MLSKVFKTQWKYPVKDDWTLQVQEDLKDFKIKMSLEEIEGKSECSFKRIVEIRSKEYALEYLLTQKTKHRRTCTNKSIEHTKNDILPRPHFIP